MLLREVYIRIERSIIEKEKKNKIEDLQIKL